MTKACRHFCAFCLFVAIKGNIGGVKRLFLQKPELVFSRFIFCVYDFFSRCGNVVETCAFLVNTLIKARQGLDARKDSSLVNKSQP